MADGCAADVGGGAAVVGDGAIVAGGAVVAGCAVVAGAAVVPCESALGVAVHAARRSRTTPDPRWALPVGRDPLPSAFGSGTTLRGCILVGGT
jgi:hypothetical protein